MADTKLSKENIVIIVLSVVIIVLLIVAGAANSKVKALTADNQALKQQVDTLTIEKAGLEENLKKSTIESSELKTELDDVRNKLVQERLTITKMQEQTGSLAQEAVDVGAPAAEKTTQ